MAENEEEETAATALTFERCSDEVFWSDKQRVEALIDLYRTIMEPTLGPDRQTEGQTPTLLRPTTRCMATSSSPNV